MTPPRNSFITKLSPHLIYGEIAGLALAISGISFNYFKLSDSKDMVMLGGTILAIALYLRAFMPPTQTDDNESTDKTKGGFVTLFRSTILPKVGGIGAAVTVIGLLFVYLHLNGANQMLLLGGTSCAIVSLAGAFFLLNEGANKAILEPLLIRVVPLAILSIWLLYSQGTNISL